MILPDDFAAAQRALFELEVEGKRLHLTKPAGVGSGPMGLTPDAERARPEVQAWLNAVNRNAAVSRAFHTAYNKRFAAEVKAERRRPDHMRHFQAFMNEVRAEAARRAGGEVAG